MKHWGFGPGLNLRFCHLELCVCVCFKGTIGHMVIHSSVCLEELVFWKNSKLKGICLMSLVACWFCLYPSGFIYHSPSLQTGYPGSSAGKEHDQNAGDLGSIPGLGKPPGEGKGYLLQYSGLENSMDCIVHRVAKSRTRLSDFHFHFSLQIIIDL